MAALCMSMIVKAGPLLIARLTAYLQRIPPLGIRTWTSCMYCTIKLYCKHDVRGPVVACNN